MVSWVKDHDFVNEFLFAAPTPATYSEKSFPGDMFWLVSIHACVCVCMCDPHDWHYRETRAHGSVEHRFRDQWKRKRTNKLMMCMRRCSQNLISWTDHVMHARYAPGHDRERQSCTSETMHASLNSACTWLQDDGEGSKFPSIFLCKVKIAEKKRVFILYICVQRVCCAYVCILMFVRMFQDVHALACKQWL